MEGSFDLSGFKFHYSPPSDSNTKIVVAEFYQPLVEKPEKIEVIQEGKNEFSLQVETPTIEFTGKGEQGKFLLVKLDKEKKIAEVIGDTLAFTPMSRRVKNYVSTFDPNESVKEFSSHRELKRLKEYNEASLKGDSVAVSKEVEAALEVAKQNQPEYVAGDRDKVPEFDPETKSAKKVFLFEKMIHDNNMRECLVNMAEQCLGDALTDEEKEEELMKEGVVHDKLKDFVAAFLKVTLVSFSSLSQSLFFRFWFFDQSLLMFSFTSC